MIYLNNAATSYPKPDCVKDALLQTIVCPPSGQFRSAGVSDAGDVMRDCRRRICLLLGLPDPDRLWFSSGSTQALNALFMGLGIPAEQIITTCTEHNSVLRPLYNMGSGAPVLLPCDKEGYVSPEHLEAELKKGRARAVVLNHCSNVTGVVQDAASFGETAHRYGALFILDVSQSAGCLPVTAEEWGVDALAFTGHKSLLGVQGTGGYYVRKDVPFRPFLFGGTGRDSRIIIYGTDTKGLSPVHHLADPKAREYETGTQNMPGIAALSAAAEFLLERGIPRIMEEERSITEYCASRLSEISHVRLIGQGPHRHGPVVSFVSDLLDPGDLAYVLQSSFGIVTRAGLHCAPLIHDHIGSAPKGTLRVSFSFCTVKDDIDRLADALKELS